MLEQSIGAKKRKLEQVKMVMKRVVILVIIVITIGYDNGYSGYNMKTLKSSQEEQEKEERLDNELLEMARKKVSEAIPQTFDLTAPLQSVTSCPIFKKISLDILRIFKS